MMLVLLLLLRKVTEDSKAKVFVENGQQNNVNIQTFSAGNITLKSRE